jgi:glycerophosphoryl diester phosphodiesterase
MCFRGLYVWFCLILLCSCKKQELEFKPLIVGHAGFGLDIHYNPYPSNSQSAIDLLKLHGGNAVELDIQLSQDGYLYCFHDARLDTRTNTSGCVPELTNETLENVNYSGFINQSIQLLNELNLSGIQTVILDLRHYNVCADEMISPILFVAPLDSFHAKNPDKEIICLTNWIELGNTLLAYQFEVAIETTDEQTAIFLAEHTSVYWFSYKNKFATKEGIASIRALGKKVIIFDVRSAEGNHEAMNKLPDVLISDAVEHALNQ